MYIFRGIDERTMVRNMGTFSEYYFDCGKIDNFPIEFLPEEMGCEPTYMGLKPRWCFERLGNSGPLRAYLYME